MAHPPCCQSLDFYLLPVHLEPERCSLWCHHLKFRYEEYKQLGKERDIIVIILIWKWVAGQMTLHSCLCQPTVLLSSQSTPVVNKSGANMHYTLGEHRTQLWTKHSQFVYRITENVVVGFWWNLASQAPCLCPLSVWNFSSQMWSRTAERPDLVSNMSETGIDFYRVRTNYNDQNAAFFTRQIFTL